MQKELLFSLLLTLGVAAMAADQDLTVLKNTAVSFLEKQLPQTGSDQWEITAGYLDPRLQLTSCPTELLKPYLPSNGHLEQTSSIGIRCESATPWSLFVPVNVHLFATVVTASHNLQKGYPVTANDVIMTREDVSRLNQGYFRSIENVVGFEVKRPVMPGHVITSLDLATPIIIHKGDTVTIQAKLGSINVSMSGKAESHAAKGDIISVKNTQSQRILQAEVVDPQTVVVRCNITPSPSTGDRS